MTGYAKLFSSILDSTIWREPNHVRLVWITMLAMSDKNGVVEASIPGLADRARVSLEKCTDALERLKSRDDYSRSKDKQGRRIEDVDGGWFLINHSKYRDLVTLQEKRAQDAERARRYRQRKKERDESREITPPSPSPSPTSSSTITKKKNPYSPLKVPLSYSPDFLTFWELWPKQKRVAKKAAFKAWKRAIKEVKDLCIINEAVEAQKKSATWLKNNGQYIPNPTTWLNQGRWEDEIILSDAPQSILTGLSEIRLTPGEQKRERNAAVIDAFRKGKI